MKENWFIYACGLVTLLVTNVTEVMAPKFVQWTLDLVAMEGAAGVGEIPSWLLAVDDTPAARTQVLHRLIGCLAVLLTIGLIGRTSWRQLLSRRTHVAGRDLKVRMWEALHAVPFAALAPYPIGDLMNRATGDWGASRAIYGFTVVASFDLIFMTVLAAACMFAIDAQLALLCLAVFPFLPRPIARLARQERQQHEKAQEQLGELSDLVTQALGVARLTRASAAEASWHQRLARAARTYADKRFAVLKTGWAIYPLAAIPTLVAYGLLVWLGSRRIASGELSIGAFVALQSYVLMLQAPLADMGECIAEWQRGFASLKRLVEVFSLERSASSRLARAGMPASEAGVGIVARDLRFAYGDALEPVLAGLQLTIEPGEVVGISGAVGSGKSTLIRLISGLRDAPQGTLTIGGIDATALSPAWIARHVAMVPQRAFLFSGTVRSNLDLDEVHGDDSLWEVLADVGLERDVRTWPGGLDAHVAEGGSNLSGGQRQRLALARALLRPRPLLLLDDCLSAVDAHTEEAILLRLRDKLPGRTILWIAHRQTTLRLCDRVYLLDEGRLQDLPRPTLAGRGKDWEASPKAAGGAAVNHGAGARREVELS